MNENEQKSRLADKILKKFWMTMSKKSRFGRQNFEKILDDDERT
ncbi:MAG: hypothetical protein ACLSG7_00905 [Clostridia bacterium]